MSRVDGGGGVVVEWSGGGGGVIGEGGGACDGVARRGEVACAVDEITYLLGFAPF